MPRGATTFNQGDVTKALKGAVKAGLSVRRVEIDPDGKIVLVTDQSPKRPDIEDATALIG